MISDFPLFVFTTLGGLAAGAYVLSVFFPVEKESDRNWKFLLTIGILLAIGLLALPFHLTRPQIAYVALMNPGSMMAQEAYWSAAFGITLLIDFLLIKFKGGSPRWLHILGAVFATVLMVVMPTAYYVVFTMPAWHSIFTYLLFFIGDIAMGMLFIAFFESSLLQNEKFQLTGIVLGIAATLVFIIEGVHYMGLGLSIVPFLISSLLGVCSVVAVFMLKQGKLPEKNASYIMFGCMFVAVAIARYSFYAASFI